jgi:hypothetical protein
MRFTLLVLNTTFVVIFMTAFAVLVLAPATVERRAHDELVQRIAAAATERYPSVVPHSWTGVLTAGLQQDAASIGTEVASPRLEGLAIVFAAMCRHCGGPEATARMLRESLSARRYRFDVALQRVAEWARGRYHELINELIFDLKIFTATNAVLSMLAALVARTRPHSWTTLLSSGILALTVTTSASLYVFRQDWLQTILFADYVGYGYTIMVCSIAVVLFDAVFNKARVLNAVLNALGSGLGN